MPGDESNPHDAGSGTWLARLRHELKATLALGLPIVIGQVGFMAMGLVDTMVAGRISTPVLAGVGLGAIFFWHLAIPFLGILFALDTFFAQAVGGRDMKSMASFLSQGLWLSLVLSAVVGVIIALSCLLYLSYCPADERASAFANYVVAIVWSLPAVFVFHVIQRYWQARHVVAAFTVIILAGNVINLVACIALGLGYWGAPRLEATGVAWATVLTRYLMLLLGIVYSHWRMRGQGWKWSRIDLGVQRRIMGLGIPAGVQTALEVWAFTAAAFVAGALGSIPLAAHNICLNVASFTFMFSLGLASAAAVRVGNFVGAGDSRRAQAAGWLCIALAAALMGIFSLGYVLIPRTILSTFTSDPAVADLGVKVFLVAACFQIADGVQVTAAGALRGLGNTKSPMIANAIGHYAIGTPIGLLLCFAFGMGIIGLWIGLAAGLAAVAVLVVLAWRRDSRKPAAPLIPLISG